MARPLRVDVEGGWYHVAARGIERRAIFGDVRDHEHFLELLPLMGENPEGYESVGSRLALGSQTFLEQVKRWAGRVTKEQPDRKQVAKRVSVAQVVSVVEKTRREGWADFANRHGDWGRELVLYLARQRSGLTLKELGEALGIPEYKTAGKAVQRFTLALPRDKAKQRLAKECLNELSLVET